MPPHSTSWKSILILSFHLWVFQMVSFPPPKPCIHFPSRATCPAHLILLALITRTILGEEYRSLSSSLCSVLHSSVTSSLLGPTTPYSETHSAYFLPSVWPTKFYTHTKQQEKYIITICINNNNNSNNCGSSQVFILLFKILMGKRKYFFKICRQFWHAPSKRFANPCVVYLCFCWGS